MDEEIIYLNELTAKRRDKLCRREMLLRLGIQWGGWLAAGLIAVAALAAHVY